MRPHALQRVLGPLGPRRIIGVAFELIPQWWHLTNGMKNLRIFYFFFFISAPQHWVFSPSFFFLVFFFLKEWADSSGGGCAYEEAAWGRLSSAPQHWVESQLVTPSAASSGFDLDEVNCPLFRCILHQPIKKNVYININKKWVFNERDLDQKFLHMKRLKEKRKKRTVRRHWNFQELVSSRRNLQPNHIKIMIWRKINQDTWFLFFLD